MPVQNNWNQAIVESMDWLFGQLPGKMTGNVIPEEIMDSARWRGHRGAVAPSANVMKALAAPPQPPPVLDNASSLQAAYDWLQVERARLEEYTRCQFEAVQAHQQEDLARHYRSEAGMAMRSQELNREMQFLASQSQALQARARELAEWESSLSAQAQKLTRAHEELLHIQKTSVNTQHDTEAQQVSLEQMRGEMAQLQTTAAAARNTFATFDTELAERQQSFQKKQAEMAARQKEMEQRYQALEKAEVAARRRLAELDDLEDRLQEEVEDQQRRLILERKEIDAISAELRGRPLPVKPA